MTKKEFSDSLIQLSLIISFSLLPSSVFAAAPPAINLPNPLGTTNLLDVGARLIQAGLGIAGSLALLFFIYGGFLWLTSAGNADKIKKGRDVFLWSIVGLVIIFSSYLLVDFVIKGLTKQGVQNQASEKQMADCGQIAQTIKDECYVGCAAPENTDPDCNNGCDEEYPINLTNCLNTK